MIKEHYPFVVESFRELGIKQCKKELKRLEKDLSKYRGINSVRQSLLIECCKEAIKDLKANK
jgi:ribosomal protein L29